MVVTRYFGGILLGTGGLVRAYSGAAKAGLEGSVIVEKKLAEKIQVVTDYNGLGKIQYIAAERGSALDTKYADKVVMTFLVPVAEDSGFFSSVNRREPTGEPELRRYAACITAIWKKRLCFLRKFLETLAKRLAILKNGCYTR